MSMIQYGIDNIGSYRHLLQNKRLGLITNPSGVNASLRSTLSILAENFHLTALYGPEHGVAGNYPAGEEFDNAVHPVYGITEYALYGKHSHLTAEKVAGVDLIVFDAQDIGSRFYTYIYTLSDAMKDCAALGVPLVVLDRPNPLGGEKCEGTLLREKFASGVGRFPMPFRHGFTAGEYALYVNDKFDLQCDLKVIPCSGWERKMDFYDYSPASWLNPSPNMTSADCALIYNGTCIFEGTNVSEGRGTTRPYEIICAPFLDGEKVTERLNKLNLPGIIFRPLRITPFISKCKHSNILCGGVQLHITDRKKVNAFECAMRLFEVIREENPQLEYTLPDHFDHLFGDDVLRLDTESISSIIERGAEESDHFRTRTAKEYFLYQ